MLPSQATRALKPKFAVLISDIRASFLRSANVFCKPASIFINQQFMHTIWQLKLGFAGINRESKPSCTFTSKKLYIFPFGLTKCIRNSNYGGCSLTVEYEPVALGTRVRLPPSAFKLLQSNSFRVSRMRGGGFDSLQNILVLKSQKISDFLNLLPFLESNRIKLKRMEI